MAARTYQTNEVHLLKPVHDKLPTNHHKSRYKTWITPKCHFCEQPETFEHLCLSKCNERSQLFRQNLKEALQKYFNKTQTPLRFQQTFLNAVQIWYNKNETTQTDWRGPPQLQNNQNEIGWTQMFKGFLSKYWREHLQFTQQKELISQWCINNGIESKSAIENIMMTNNIHKDYMVTFTEDKKKKSSQIHPTRHLAGIIKIIWTEMGNMWHNHLQYIYKKEATISHHTKQLELQNQIQMLHGMKEQTLAIHRSRYFFNDVEQYVQNASIQQMTQYIHHYLPVIMNSIRQATKLATNTMMLTRFTGFTRTTHQKDRTHPALEETPHRKHTRIRTPILRRITEYFTNKSHQKHTPPTSD